MTTWNGLIDQVKEHATREYSSVQEGLGHFLSHLFKWDGDDIILAAAYGCEDANWHTEASLLFDLHKRNTQDEDAPEQSEIVPETDSPEKPFARLIASNPLRYGFLKDYQHAAAHGEMTIQKMARDIETLQQRVKLLEEKLTPFALAAKDEDVQRADANLHLMINGTPPLIIYVDETALRYLDVVHLREALAVLPELTNAGGDSQ